MIGFDSWTLCKVELLHSEIVISFLSPIENSSKIELKEKKSIQEFYQCSRSFQCIFMAKERKEKCSFSHTFLILNVSLHL